MNDIKYDKKDFSFAYRVSAIIYNNDKSKILLFRGDGKNYYMLPGGKVHELEKSEDAIKREIVEEIGFDNLEFEFVGISEEIIRQKENNIQQITLTYKSIYRNEIKKEKFKSIETDWMNFEWIDISTLSKYELHPSCLVELVNNSNIKHLVEEIEYEVRVLEINKDEIQSKLKELNATLIEDVFQKRYVYDFNPIVPNKWIR